MYFDCLNRSNNSFAQNSLSTAHRQKFVAALPSLGFDPRSTPCLKRFQPLKEQSGCIFAKKAKVWGGPDWVEELDLNSNLLRHMSALSLFMDVGRGLGLDGYVLEIKGNKVKSLESFGGLVMDVLCGLCELEGRCGCMRGPLDRIGKFGWWFEFGREQVFVTTFAPFYDRNHSRFQFDCPSDSAYVLFQPEYSFARRDISCGHEPTVWKNPTSARDKVRCSFLNMSQNYVHRPDIDKPNELFVENWNKLKGSRGAEQNYGPTAWQLVKDTRHQGRQSYVEWWTWGQRAKRKQNVKK
eukprot:TRINITY_DN4224_c0_g1_i1.p1 TRINITY_DN4224_c0_g1~~TRINITY_DN4224_c0_g1_i1.p1  ORF type:complete len:296 (+),score=4.20 TRINITY_DN4224_c0_g1_i1:312-1199(+)